jgi:hypothetical protein
MEFRLVYDGELPAASQRDKRVIEKHEIRRTFAGQLATLWETHPRLRRDAARAREHPDEGTHPDLYMVQSSTTPTGHLMTIGHAAAQRFSRCDRVFIPLITNDNGVGCALDILFLRRDQPGDLINSGGDIDNRIKVLFDALRLPANETETFGRPEDDPNPFYCLLEDDRLITDVRVTTDRLLTPRRPGEHENDVRLIIHVRTIVIDPGNLVAVTF